MTSMFKKIVLIISITLLFSQLAVSQNYYYQEIGVFAGPSFLKSDFGERGNFENFVKNNGFTAGIIYYFSNDNDYNSLKDNFKLRLEASYFKADLDHFGKYVDSKLTTIQATQLRAMHGKTSAVNLGFQVEFYPFKMDDYARGIKFSPYVSLGSLATFYSSNVTSDLGLIGTTSTTPTKYIGATRTAVSKFAASFTSSVGTRVKLSDYNSLMFEAKLQYFMSDWVDGMNPDKNVYKENKANDYFTSFNIGYIYYFNE